MIHTAIKNHQLINDQIRNDKVKIGKSFFLTEGGPNQETEVIFWESLNNSNEKSNLIIKNFVSMSNGCKIILGGNHRSDWACQNLLINRSSSRSDEIVSNGDIIIGNDVWIGYGVVILSGTVIPDGCVIGAMSVVKGKFEPYDIIVGNPGKSVKKRFDKETIDFLLELKWWDWTEDNIKKYSDVLKSNDIEKLKEIYKNNQNL